MESQTLRWPVIAARLKVVKLSFPVQLLAPSLFLATLSRSTRGISFYPGRAGFGLGASLVVASLTIGGILGGEVGLLALSGAMWLIGTYGILMAVSSVRPFAIVKPICVRCRLLPIILEHEAIHLSGVAGETEVWGSMRLRHCVESLMLDGDPKICSFCPIPKRLSEH